jgi:hypothetical protein
MCIVSSTPEADCPALTCADPAVEVSIPGGNWGTDGTTNLVTFHRERSFFACQLHDLEPFPCLRSNMFKCNIRVFARCNELAWTGIWANPWCTLRLIVHIGHESLSLITIIFRPVLLVYIQIHVGVAWMIDPYANRVKHGWSDCKIPSVVIYCILSVVFVDVVMSGGARCSPWLQ